MKLVYRYIATTMISGILLALFFVVGVDSFFAFVRELRYIGVQDYNAMSALQYVVLGLPRRMYNMFPMACLLGTLMSLGMLASHNELIVMRAAGVSLSDMAWAVLRVGLVLTVLVTLMEEYVVPKTEYTADFLRATARGKGQAMLTSEGAWLRDSTSFIHIKRILPGGRMTGITRYEFGGETLRSVSYSDEALFDGKQWMLGETKQSDWLGDRIDTRISQNQVWDTDISPDLLSILVSRPENLSIRGLYGYIGYLNDNGLDSTKYSLVFWNKMLQPVETLVMIFLAIPFIFGPLRATSMGLRVVAGVLVGFGFYVLNELFSPLSVVYHFPPWLAAMVPTVVFGLLAWVLLRRAY